VVGATLTISGHIIDVDQLLQGHGHSAVP